MAKPFASKAQMERFRRLAAEGVISQKEFDDSLAMTPDPDKLPERLHPKKEKPKKENSGPNAS